MRAALDKRINEAGVEIRDMANRCMTKRASEGEDNESDTSENKTRNVVSLDSEAEELKLMKDTIADRRQAVLKKLIIDRQRLEMKQERGKEETESAERALDLHEKEIAIEQSRIQMERQKLVVELAEPKTVIEERKIMVSLISSLAKKIS